MKFIRNLKIRVKLLLLFSLLLIPTIIFLTIIISSKIADKNEMLQVQDNFSEIMLISAVIHQLQEERALTYGYLTARGSEFANRLRAQREQTNLAIQELRVYAEKKTTFLFEFQQLNYLSTQRIRVDNLMTDSLEFESFYQSVRNDFFIKLREEANQVDDQQVREQLLSVVQLISAKEYLGQIRTLSNQIFSRGAITVFDFNHLNYLTLLHNQHIQQFVQLAGKELKEYHTALFNNPQYQSIQNLLNNIRQNPEIDITHIDAVEWHKRYTNIIDDLRKTELESYLTINNIVEHKLNQANTQLTGYLLIVLVFISLSLWLSVAIIRYIISSVVLLRQVSHNVSQGMADVDIPETGRDEFGLLAESFREVVNRNRELALAANEIGGGNYDAYIALPVKHDVLRNSLIQMRNNLKELSEENQSRNWLLSGLYQLNDLMGGITDLPKLSKLVTTHLCSYTGAQLGALFIPDRRHTYCFTAGFGADAESGAHLNFKPGEGIAGEAVIKKQPVVMTDVPAGTFKIKTGLVETEPLHLMIVPAVYENEVVAVIELASRHLITGLQQQFITDAAERIAIAVKTLRSNIETQELLHETQSQAEELENQQQELKQINIELNHQRDELEASEEELRASQKELEVKNLQLTQKTVELEKQHRMLSVKNQELEDARQVIELKMKQVETVSGYKTEFLANMSHELRTPLNSILLLSRIIMDNASLNGNEKDAEHANVIHSAGGDLLKLINEILDLSRIESGQIELDVKETNIRTLNSPREFTELAKRKNITYEIITDSQVPDKIKTDAFRLEQIIRNLLSNAFKFTPENGSIELRITRNEGPVGLKSHQAGRPSEAVVFAVKDTGMGIPKDKQELIFEAFKQADASTTRKYGGTGLGLSISRELAHLLGGELLLESEPGKGSTFSLYLPVSHESNNTTHDITKEEKTESVTGYFPPTDVQPAVNAPQIAVEPSNGTTVMIIEDDKAFNNVLADYARNKQFHVMQAFTGEEGLKMLHESPPDALLLDIHLPDMTGWDILRNMISNNLMKRVQVHLMSAYEFRNELQEHHTFNSCLQKPVTLESISKAFIKIAGKNNMIKKMLIVEDNEVENHAISELLTGHQISTEAAYSGREAIEKLMADHHDGVILDLMLPDMDGYDVMEDIRKKDKNIPIIIYSGKEITQKEETKLKKYANTIIIKNSFSYARLLDEVKLFLHQVNLHLTDRQQYKIDLHVPSNVLRNKKVLLVDDDARNIYSLYSFLEKEGMDIIVANDGREAVECLKNEDTIDIVLMDIMMPGMDGIEATKTIRKMKKYSSIPIIAITAKAMKEDRENCIKAGASDYVSKPVNIEKLISLMRVWIYDALG